MKKTIDTFKYNITCIKEMDGCFHAVRVNNNELEAWPGSILYIHLKSLGRNIPEHLQHYAETCSDNLPPLPNEDDEL